MFKSLSFYIGLRYSCSKKHQWFVSFIVLASMIGIALGVCVLITVLSVMNGFNDEIENQVFRMAPHILVTNANFDSSKRVSFIKDIDNNFRIKNSAPYILEYGLVKTSDILKPIVVHGIEPKQENKLSSISSNLLSGTLNDLTKGSYKVLISQKLGYELGLFKGDKIVIMIANIKTSPIGLIPRYKRFTIAGFFHGSHGLGIDNSYVMMNIDDAKKLYQYGDRISGIRLQTGSLYAAPAVAKDLRNELSQDYYVTDWTMQYGSHLKAVKLEKMMMLLILSLLIVIAAFNLISSLVMIVNEKQPDIAILRTMGVRAKTILSIFLFQGSLVGLFGTIMGVCLGLLLSFNVSFVVDILLKLVNLDGLLSAVYKVDHFPSKVMVLDVLIVSIVSMLLSLLATIYPAWKASKLNPVEILRYE